MRKIIYILSLFLVASIALHSQSLNFVRNDVDSSRSRFVTATYVFSIDIVAENIQKCTNVSFELRYNKTQFVRFSEWKRGEFGSTTKTLVLSLPDASNDIGRLVVSSGMDYTRDTNAPDNPKVVNLKFVVIPAAPHFDVVTFSLINPRITVVADGQLKLVDLPTSSISYTIHSFVNVWPGDANNDGVVNHLDFATVSYFLGFGPNTKQMRSFKREPASTLWAPQPVIAWDTAAATYADCDGNGEVNMIDNLVISYNYDKQHPTGSIINNTNQEIELPAIVVQKSGSSIIYPIYVSTYQPYLSLAGTIEIPNLQDFEVQGIEPSGLLDGNKAAFSIWKSNQNTIEFSIGTVSKTNLINNSGVVANLVLEPKNPNLKTPDVAIKNLRGISSFGHIFELSAFTSVAEKFENQDVFYSNNTFYLNSCFGKYDNLEIYNLLGELVYKTDIGNSSSIDLASKVRVRGVLIAKFSNSNETKIQKIILE